MKRALPLLALCALLIGQATDVVAQTRFKTLNYLYSISGSKVISGQHNDQKDGTTANTYTNRVNSITGKFPALYSGDMLFSNDANARWQIAYEAERQWNAGAMVNIMWHACPPTQGNVCNWDGGLLSYLNDAQWADLTRDGGYLNGIWKSRIDEIVPYLQYLEDRGVEVLWRPLHEQNQGAFWWGGRTGPNGTAKLFQLTHDYMTNVKGLSNLIWVWDVQDLSTNYGDYNPGNNYFDVAALDVYGDAYSNSSYYNALLGQAGNKPMIIGECGQLPPASLLQNQPRWVAFMNWSYLLQQNNSNTYIQDVYNNPRVLTRDEMPGWNGVPDNLAKGKAVTVSSTEAGNNVASNATDGSYGTRWSSVYADPQWLQVDLGANYAVNRVKITWETAAGRDFLVQVSADGSNWTTLRTVTANAALTTDYTGLSGTGRYLRVYGTARATVYGYSIYELEVYGTVPQSPYGGVAASIPGTIQAENYDLGGEGVAYRDLSAGNAYTAYRTDNVDLEACTDAGGGYNLAATQATEWLEYTVNVTAAGAYNLSARVATTSAGRTFHIEMDGQNISGTINVPNTGGWQTWQTVSVNNINLTAGQKVMRIVMDADLFNLNYVSFQAAGVVNQAPLVSLTAPTAGSYNAPANINIAANASDNDGTISKVDFYQGSTLLYSDNTAPYSYSWNNVSAGSYSITARATDNQGAVSTSAAVTVVVNNVATNQAPTVSLTGPTTTSYVAPASINITANASDNDGTISKVDFYQGSTLLFSDNTAPYAYSWTNVSAGSYSISARATDNQGAVSTSAAVTVTVTNPTNNCTGIAAYKENNGYVAGSKVQNGGVIYQCKPWPYSGWCNGAAWAYGPGTGTVWTDAWTQIGTCSGARIASAQAVSLSPNPADDKLEISTEVLSTVVTIEFIDSYGTQVFTTTVGTSAGKIDSSIDISTLPAGLYIVKITDGNEVKTSRVFVQ